MVFSRFFKSRKQQFDPVVEAPPKPALPTDEPLPTSGPASATSPASTPAEPVNVEEIKQGVIDILRTVYDPEIPVNIYEMGLVYGIEVDPAGNAVVHLTLTSPGCPVAASLPLEVETKTLMVPGVNDARIELVWDPPWDPSMMSEAARLQLGFL